MQRVEYEKLVIQDLLNLYRAKELDLNPWYQRRSVWTRPQKAYLINSIFEQKPIPSIYIRHSLDIESEKSMKQIVDGQQRVRAIIEYCEEEYAARHPEHRRPVKRSDLTPTQRSTFLMTSLSVGYLLGADDPDVIEIFGRLNSVAKTLNAQEKRNAKYSGEFKQFCLRESAQRVQMWRDLGIFTANSIARMQEVQFVSDLVLNMLNGLSDYSAARLDNIYVKFDDTFPKAQKLAARLEHVFARIASLNPAAVRDTIFSRHPLFFSLCIVLDSARRPPGKARLEDGLYLIDKRFNSDTPPSQRSQEEAEFHGACTASTQRIKTRKIRDRYIRRALKVK